MTNYTKATDFAAKDALLTGNPSKLIKGTEIGAEFDAIQAADATSMKGPVSSTDNAVVRFDSTGGKLTQNSGVTISDGDIVTATGFAGPINGTVGAITPSAGAFTTLDTTGDITGGTGTGTKIIVSNGGNSGSVGGSWVGAQNAGVIRAAIGNTSALVGGAYDGTAMVYGAGNVRIAPAGTTVATVSPSGVDVTGALSVTTGQTILNSTSSTPALVLRDASTSQGTLQYGNNVTTYNIRGGADYLGIETNVPSSNSVRNKVNGVTVTDTSSTGLAVTGALSTTGSITASASANIGTTSGYANFTAAGLWIGSAGAGAGISLRVNGSGTDAVTLDTAGNLGLGVTPSAWGAGLKAVQIGERTAVYDSGANSFVVNNYYNDNTNYRYIASAAASDYYQSAGAHVFRASPSGTAGGVATLTQIMAVGKGTTLALEGATSAAGTGIAFPATRVASSNANTLDDYEEGTWTPGIRFGGGSTGVTYSAGSQSGVYTKIGNLVTCTGTFALTNRGSSTGVAQLDGLPFTGKLNSSGPNYIPSLYANTLTMTGALMGLLVPTFSVVNLYAFSGGSSTAIDHTNFNNTSAVSITISYQTDS